MTNTTAPATVEAMHAARIRYAGVEGHVQSTYTRGGVVDEIVIRLDNGRVIDDLTPDSVEWLPARLAAPSATPDEIRTVQRTVRDAVARLDDAALYLARIGDPDLLTLLDNERQSLRLTLDRLDDC